MWLHNTVNVLHATELYIFKNYSNQAVQWLILHAPNAGVTGSIPGWGTNSLHASGHSVKKEFCLKLYQNIKFPDKISNKKKKRVGAQADPGLYIKNRAVPSSYC